MKISSSTRGREPGQLCPGFIIFPLYWLENNASYKAKMHLTAIQLVIKNMSVRMSSTAQNIRRV